MTIRKGTYNVPAAYIILRRKGKILFTLREHTGYQDGMYSLPSGHVEEGENFLAAAARETLEEVGVAVARTKLNQVHTMHRMAENDVRIDLFFEAESWEGEPYNNEPHKHGPIQWLAPEEMLQKPIMDYQQAALRAIADGKAYSEWGWPEYSGT